MVVDDTAQIKEAITELNQYRDLGLWDRLEKYFIETPYVDDSALTKEVPGIKHVKHVVNNWRRELKSYFYATRHNIRGLNVNLLNKKEAQASTDTTGQYFITDRGNRYVLTVMGTYNYKLVKKAGQWKIGQIQFEMKDQFLRPVGAPAPSATTAA